MIQLLEHFTYKKLIRFYNSNCCNDDFLLHYGVVDGLFVSKHCG